jgi:hypothetical protein
MKPEGSRCRRRARPRSEHSPTFARGSVASACWARESGAAQSRDLFRDFLSPAELPGSFEDFAIKTTVFARNYLDRNEIVYESALTPAVASRRAVSGLFRSEKVGNSILVDGGSADPPICSSVRLRRHRFRCRCNTWRTSASSMDTPAVRVNVRRGANHAGGRSPRNRSNSVPERPRASQSRVVRLIASSCAGQIARAGENREDELKFTPPARMRTPPKAQTQSRQGSLRCG